MILRTVYKPSDFWPAGATSGIEYQTQVSGVVTYLGDYFASEAEAGAAFPNVSGHWDPLGVGDTWEDWSMDAACIMEAFERAAQETKYWERGIAPGVVEFDPGVYHVSMGHVWFYSAVRLKGAEYCRFDGCMNSGNVWDYAGTNPTWWESDSARAVLTIGHDSDHRPTLANSSGIIAFNAFSMNLPRVNNYENEYTGGIGSAKGAGIRFLSLHDMTIRDIGVSGPFKYGIIFCAESTGSAFNHFYLNIIHGCLVALKWHGRNYQNDCNIYCGSFTQRQSPLTDSGWNPFTKPTIILDADKSTYNPHQNYDATVVGGAGHWEFMNVSFETNDTVQFMRASGVDQWHFHNSRWEALDRPARGPYLWPGASGEVGYYQYPKLDWYLSNCSHISFEGGSSQFMLYGVPSGVWGKAVTMHNSYNAPSWWGGRNHGATSEQDYKMTNNQFEEIMLHGQNGGLILDSWDGTNSRYRVQLSESAYSSAGDRQVIAKPVPKTGLQWRNYDQDGNWGTGAVVVSGGTNIQLRHTSTNIDWITVYIRQLNPYENSVNQIVYTTNDFDSDGYLKVGSMQPITTLGTHLIYVTAGKYLTGTTTIDYDAGTDYVRYPFSITTYGV